MTVNSAPDRPAEHWTLARLGNYCSLGQKKMAVHAWRFGHALNLARAKQAHGDWQAWKQRYVPGLSHSSEHRYRTLARSLPEGALEGIGLTEAYRLLDLAGVPDKGKKRGHPFTQAAEAGGVPPTGGGTVATGADEPDEDAPDAADNLAELSPPPRLPLATGLMESEGDDASRRINTGPMEVEAEPEVAVFASEPVGEESPGERYRTLLLDARTHLDALRCWADWLKQRDEIFLVEMWDKHGVDGVAAQMDRTVESLRWVAGNLVW